MTQKTFLLGLGAQKSGTTWLHDYLSSSPQADMGFAKEYHIFDALTVAACREHIPSVRADLRLLAGGPRAALRVLKGLRHTTRRQALYEDTRNYFDYFQALLKPDRIRLTGDITPAYSALDAATLRTIKAGFAERGVRVRAVFLMRDPVERCWSAVRMFRRRLKRRDPAAYARESAEQALLRQYRTEDYVIRTDYRRTLEACREAFDADELRVLLYEDLFQEAVIADLCDFLGIDPAPPDLERARNASPKGEPLAEATRREIAAFYGDVYRHVAATVSPEVLMQRWKNARFVLDPQERAAEH